VNFHAMILSAGSGKRMGTKEKKQFLMVGDKCVFLHSLLTFAKIREIKRLLLVYNKDDYQRYKIIIDKEELSDRVVLIEGGEERKDSVQNGLKYLMENADKNDVVLIHDAARPLIDIADIRNLMNVLVNCKGATLAYKIVDTIKEVEKDDIISKNISREKLWGIMTPQGFELGTIWEAHQKFGNINVTDDTELLFKMGLKIKVVEGQKTNLKLTTQEDFKIINIFLSSKVLKIESPHYIN